MPSASPGGFPRSVTGSDSFQITVSGLGFRACEIWCMLFKNRVSVSYNPLGLPKMTPADLQSQAFWRLIFLVQDPWAASLTWDSFSLVLGENLFSCDYPPIVGHPHGVMGLDYTEPPPPLPFSLWFLLYIFSCIFSARL